MTGFLIARPTSSNRVSVSRPLSATEIDSSECKVMWQRPVA
jgi:hypothetical protein